MSYNQKRKVAIIIASPKPASLTRRFVLFLMLSAVPLFLVLAFTTWKDLEDDQRQADRNLQQELRHTLHEVEDILGASSRYIQQLALHAELVANSPAAPGGSRNLGSNFAASTRRMSPQSTLNDAIAESLFPPMFAGHATIPFLVESYWLASSQDSYGVYPAMSTQDFVASHGSTSVDQALEHSFDARGTLPLKMAGPVNNPEKKVLWSDPFRPEGKKSLLVTLVAPVWSQISFQGVVACDLDLSVLATALGSTDQSGGSATLVVDSSGLVLGDSHGRLAEHSTTRHITDLYPQFPLPRGLTYNPETLVRREDLTFMTQSLSVPGWTLLSITQDSLYYRNRGITPFNAYLIASMAGVVYLLAGTLLTLYFARPAKRLTLYVEDVLKRPGTSIPRVPALWRSTFEHIGALARERVQAVDQVRAERASLEQTVKERTRELSETNRELIDNMVRLRDTKNLLVRSEKLAALGRLVAGVAHELNTPIGNALTMGSTLRSRTLEIRDSHEAGNMTNKAFNEYLKTMVDSTHILESEIMRSATLVNDFKQVALDQTSVQRRIFLLDEVIAEVCATIRPRFKEGPWVLAVEVQPGITMDSFPGPLGQILNNLAFNALTHGFDTSHEGIFHIEALHHGREQVVFLISDNGRGIAPEHHEKVFEPFFTTRRDSENIGLGLNIVQHLVTTILGGTIELESDINRGCRFRIVVPLVAPYSHSSGVPHG